MFFNISLVFFIISLILFNITRTFFNIIRIFSNISLIFFNITRIFFNISLIVFNIPQAMLAATCAVSLFGMLMPEHPAFAVVDLRPQCSVVEEDVAVPFSPDAHCLHFFDVKASYQSSLVSQLLFGVLTTFLHVLQAT
jgi:hypothetical protein